MVAVSGQISECLESTFEATVSGFVSFFFKQHQIRKKNVGDGAFIRLKGGKGFWRG